jgi:hypothetical protein
VPPPAPPFPPVLLPPWPATPVAPPAPPAPLPGVLSPHPAARPTSARSGSESESEDRRSRVSPMKPPNRRFGAENEEIRGRF